MPGITQKQENFCRIFVEIGNASESYRQAYEAEDMKPATVWNEAYKLQANPDVAARIDQLRKEAIERHKITVDSLTMELEQARWLAIKTEQPSSAVSATLGKAKLHGLITDKNELSGPNGGPIETKNKSDDEINRRIAELAPKD